MQQSPPGSADEACTAAGAIFGLGVGSCLATIGTILGQTMAFCVGRWRPPALALWNGRCCRGLVDASSSAHWLKWQQASPDTGNRARRFLLREVVSDYMSRHWPKWSAVDAAISKDGWKMVMLLRLSPIVPWYVAPSSARPALLCCAGGPECAALPQERAQLCGSCDGAIPAAVPEASF